MNILQANYLIIRNKKNTTFFLFINANNLKIFNHVYYKLLKSFRTVKSRSLRVAALLGVFLSQHEAKTMLCCNHEVAQYADSIRVQFNASQISQDSLLL